MNIIVCLKQTPAEDSIKFDSKGNLIRENIKLVNNYYDEYALENALILKDKYRFKVIALTMGPTSADEIIRYAISKGVDDGYIITDPKLKGSDALITSLVISKSIEKIAELKKFTVFFGVKSQDGETGIVPSEVAKFLNLPIITSASEIDFLDDGFIITKNSYSKTIKFKTRFNCCVSFDISKIKPRIISIKNKIKAKNSIITKLSLNDLSLDLDGLKDSPTGVIELKEGKGLRERSFNEININEIEQISELKKTIYE